jgi:hypothetical protein
VYVSRFLVLPFVGYDEIDTYARFSAEIVPVRSQSRTAKAALRSFSSSGFIGLTSARKSSKLRTPTGEMRTNEPWVKLIAWQRKGKVGREVTEQVEEEKRTRAWGVNLKKISGEKGHYQLISRCKRWEREVG